VAQDFGQDWLAGAGQNLPSTRPLFETFGRSPARANTGKTIPKAVRMIASTRTLICCLYNLRHHIF
jgi:hypothetical protein